MKEVIKTARIMGWGEFFSTVRYLMTDPKAREQEFYDYGEGCSLLGEMNAALRALGLPEDWKYNEADLRRARTPDRAKTFYAINYLVGVHMHPAVLGMIEEQRRRRREEQLVLPAPRKLLPGARP